MEKDETEQSDKRTKVYTKLTKECRVILSEHGINIGIDHLLRLVHVSKMGLYQNFKTKAEMLIALINELEVDCLVELRGAAESAPKRPSCRKVRSVVEDLCKMAAGMMPGKYELLTLIQGGLPSPHDPVHKRAVEAKVKIASLLTELLKSTDVPIQKVDPLVEDLMTILDGITVRRFDIGSSEARLAGEALALRVMEAAGA